MTSEKDKRSVLSETSDIKRQDVRSVVSENLRDLKKARSLAKSIVSEKRNEINELLSSSAVDIDELNKRVIDLDTAKKQFLIDHENYHKNLRDAADIEESHEYYEAENRRVNILKERVSHLSENFRFKDSPNVSPEDSVSNSGVSAKTSDSKQPKFSRKSASRVSSRASSSLSSAKVRATARKASLEVEAASFRKKMALQQEELRLQQQREALDLEIKLAKANAEERAYSRGEDENLMVRHISSTRNDQEIVNLSPPKIHSQTPVCARESSREVVHSSLNPNAQEWQQTSPTVGQPTSVSRDAAIGVNDDLSVSFVTAQKQQNEQIERLLKQQQQHTAALLLPQPEVPIFKGEPTEYCAFIRAFENLIESKTDNSSARLFYLVQYTDGDVKELMNSCLAMRPEAGYREARRLLKEKYGQDYKIAAAYVDRLIKGPLIKPEDGVALQRFSVLLASCKNTLTDIGYLNKLENPDAMKKVVERLPYALRQKWREVVDDILQRQNRDVTVEDIASFVEKRARVASHPVFGSVTSDQKNNDSGKPRPKPGFSTRKSTSFLTQAEPKPQPTVRTSNARCILCNQSRWLSQCANFKKKSFQERLNFVRRRGICDNCLARGHLARSCDKSSFCRVQGCEVKHSTFLHPPTRADEQRGNMDEDKSTEGQATVRGIDDKSQPEKPGARSGYVKTGESLQGMETCSPQATSLAIVPVKVKATGGSKMIETYAFLDGGSNTTFCTEKLIKQLGTVGRKTNLSLTTMAQEDSPIESSIVSLEVFDLKQDNLVTIPTAFSTPKLPVCTKNMATAEDLKKWNHFVGIKIPEINAEVSLLIGSDIPQALEPWEVRRGQKGEPYATKTALGWVVNGPLGRKGITSRTANFISADIELKEQFERYCNMEFNDSHYNEKAEMSQEDRRALTTMSETVELKDGHYEMALPWKHKPPNLPNNRPLAEHRLKLLQRRLTKDSALREKYSAFIDDLLHKGYARKVPAGLLAQPDELAWYLPHHPVFHPQKPNKVRVVFDCSARYQGTSLNEQLLQGPDLTNPLVGVLIRFREEPIALIADIEAMFHQVRVNPDDCKALRFLWWPDGDFSQPAEEFQMMVHLFGGTSSPSCASFALRRTAEDNERNYDGETIQTIRRNFYVDDCLKSVRSESEAVRLADQLRQCLAKGGFRLTKWVSNSPAVIKSIPESERAPSIMQLDFDRLNHVERPLGVQWNVASDKFGFNISVKDRPQTRRGILSVVSSIYDPMGFVAPFILPAKAILQELCRKKLGWDDPIPDDYAQRWQQWLKELPQLEQLEVDRCFKPHDFGRVISRQLHHFSDASQEGYGAVSYLRMVNSRGDIHCSFVIGKARLAPLKPMTIPRMELSAAVVSTRLERMIHRELSEPTTSESVYWTDSTCVIRYIGNEDKRFQTFVANRVATIREVSPPTQWRYVNTSCNPADDASRGLTAESFLQERRWLRGPQFLWLPEENWPEKPAGISTEVEEDDPEVKRTSKTFATVGSDNSRLVTEVFGRISSWYRLKKFVAWIMRYKRNLKAQCVNRRNGGSTVSQTKDAITPLSIEEMRYAETEVLKQVQKESFSEELSAKSIKKSSPIYKLDAIKEEGLLRVGGRLRHAPIEPHAKHPVILPKQHHVVDLIVRHYHEICGHSGLEYVLSMTRQHFWIIKARRTIRRILDSCFDCRRRQASVGTQKMADLPEDRVTPYAPPFTYVGADYFGPLMVKRGRSLVKRYGVLFTCLSIRAVHIEIAHSLDTCSFINALRRFAARRGQPQEIRSDNGSNFVGGQKELKEAIAHWNQQQIHEFLLQKSTKWIFNPPAGSHHGGVWERCIRTVRKVIVALLKHQTLDDEGLLTLISEVESIVNGRPITKVSDDPRDYDALTPNHLLLLRRGPCLPPTALGKHDMYSSRWRRVQYLADVFWRRWVNEYLPSLQQRQKWNSPSKNFAVGDIVLVVDEKCPRSSWPLGRVLETFPNRHDGHVRRVKVKTMKSTFDRPIDKLVHLESAEG